MPTATLGTPAATLGNVNLGDTARPTSNTRVTFLQVFVNGGQVDNVLGARVSLGFDQAVSEATFDCAADSGTVSGWRYNSTVEIYMGAGNNNSLRFRGLLKEKQSN